MRTRTRAATHAVRAVTTATLFAMSMAAIAACGGGATDQGASWPTVDVVSTDGDTVSTGDWTGEPLVVNFWYSTCAPCAQELQDFATVDGEYGDEVRFVGVNPLDSPGRMTDFAGERGVSYELFQDPLAELQTELGITTFPSTYFVSPDGEYTAVHGALDADSLRADVDRLLAGDDA